MLSNSIFAGFSPPFGWHCCSYYYVHSLKKEDSQSLSHEIPRIAEKSKKLKKSESQYSTFPRVLCVPLSVPLSLLIPLVISFSLWSQILINTAALLALRLLCRPPLFSFPLLHPSPFSWPLINNV